MINSKKIIIGIASALLLSIFTNNSFAHNNCYNNCGNGNGNGNIDIENKREMLFPLVISGYRQNIVVTADSAYAATFSVKGYPYARIRIKVDEDFYIYANNKDKILVTDITYGGDLNYYGYAYLDRYGELNNVRVGGTAIINNKDNERLYNNYIKIKAYYE